MDCHHFIHLSSVLPGLCPLILSHDKESFHSCKTVIYVFFLCALGSDSSLWHHVIRFSRSFLLDESNSGFKPRCLKWFCVSVFSLLSDLKQSSPHVRGQRSPVVGPDCIVPCAAASLTLFTLYLRYSDGAGYLAYCHLRAYHATAGWCQNHWSGRHPQGQSPLQWSSEM